jgi:CheY-like chemotaxis protein
LNKQSLSLLLVEDHHDSATALAYLLRQYGHRVQAAGCCASARRMYADDRFDVVLCDLGLPDGDGCDLIAELSLIRPVRALAITGYGMPQDLKRTQAAGFLAHLTKPVVVERLRIVLGELSRQIAMSRVAGEQQRIDSEPAHA